MDDIPQVSIKVINKVTSNLIDIERRKKDCLSFVYVPATSAAHNRLLFFFLLRLFTVLMKKTHAVKHSIILDVYEQPALNIGIQILTLERMFFYLTIK